MARQYEGRARVGGTYQIRVGDLKKCDVFGMKPGTKGTLDWQGFPSGQCRFEALEDALSLSWETDDHGTICHIVRPSRSPCHYGGSRTWFLCPYCSRRVAALHISSAGHQLACRHCFNMTYPSRNVDAVARSQMRKAKLCKKLDGKTHGGGVFEKTPPRPKGMHRKTYRAIKDRILDEQEAMIASLSAFLGKTGGGRWPV